MGAVPHNPHGAPESVGMSARIFVHNPVGSPVMFSSEGRMLPGHASAWAWRYDPVTSRLLAGGHLLVCHDHQTPDPLNPSPEPEPEPVPVPVDPEPTPDVPMPNAGASKKNWTSYALSQGVAEEDLAGKTRDQIRDLFTDVDTPAPGDPDQVIPSDETETD